MQEKKNKKDMKKIIFLVGISILVIYVGMMFIWFLSGMDIASFDDDEIDLSQEEQKIKNSVLDSPDAFEVRAVENEISRLDRELMIFVKMRNPIDEDIQIYESQMEGIMPRQDINLGGGVVEIEPIQIRGDECYFNLNNNEVLIEADDQGVVILKLEIDEELCQPEDIMILEFKYQPINSLPPRSDVIEFQVKR